MYISVHVTQHCGTVGQKIGAYTTMMEMCSIEGKAGYDDVQQMSIFTICYI